MPNSEIKKYSIDNINAFDGIIPFTKISLPFGEFQNMAQIPIEADGTMYPSSEHFFLCNRLNDVSIRYKLLSLTPYNAKKEYKKQTKSDPNVLKHKELSVEDLKLMYNTISLKIQQNPSFKELLLSTGNKYLIEDVTTRVNINSSALFWGACEINRNAELQKSCWVGKNYLGRILMYHRDNLIESEL